MTLRYQIRTVTDTPRVVYAGSDADDVRRVYEQQVARAMSTADEVMYRQRIGCRALAELSAQIQSHLDATMPDRLWFRMTLPARGVKIPSRRRARVWLKQVQRGVHAALTPPDLKWFRL